MTASHWACASCPTTGTTDRAAERHVKDTTHSVLTASTMRAAVALVALVKEGVK